MISSLTANIHVTGLPVLNQVNAEENEQNSRGEHRENIDSRKPTNIIIHRIRHQNQ